MTTKAQTATKKIYTKPVVKSARIYERLALGCTKASAPCRPPLKSA
jgi:hypothetical protein